eukprot:12898188-Alexandrium_andersonii.AAC.1
MHTCICASERPRSRTIANTGARTSTSAFIEPPCMRVALSTLSRSIGDVNSYCVVVACALRERVSPWCWGQFTFVKSEQVDPLVTS